LDFIILLKMNIYASIVECALNDIWNNFLDRSDTPLELFIQKTIIQFDISFYELKIAIKYLYRISSNIRKLSPYRTDAVTNRRKMFIVSLILVKKYHNDKHFKNVVWAVKSRILLGELNRMEVDFLKMINYNLRTDDNLMIGVMI
jgi:Cyclin